MSTRLPVASRWHMRFAMVWALARARWALNQHPLIVIERFNDAALLAVCRQREVGLRSRRCGDTSLATGIRRCESRIGWTTPVVISQPTPASRHRVLSITKLLDQLFIDTDHSGLQPCTKDQRRREAHDRNLAV